MEKSIGEAISMGQLSPKWVSHWAICPQRRASQGLRERSVGSGVPEANAEIESRGHFIRIGRTRDIDRDFYRIGSFIPGKSANDQEVVKGQKIVFASCISCHHLGNAGAQLALPSWAEVAASAMNSKDIFWKYVTNPRSMNPLARMPSYQTFDDHTFNAVEAYIKAIMPFKWWDDTADVEKSPA
jgi:hypothetical protein